MTISIYYDGDCPFCAQYVTLMRLKETAGTVNLFDLRENEELRQELTQDGFDLDKGMVVEMASQRFGGADAVNQIALLTTPSSIFNKVNKILFSSRFAAGILYPFLRAGRWLVLFLLGRDQLVDGGGRSTSRAAIFGSLFALFSVFHFLNYTLEYGRFSDIQIDLLAVVFAAILLFVKPDSPRLLFLLMLASTISAIAQAPIGSNHTIVRNFVVLGYWISFIYAMMKGLRWSDIFTNFTTAGQACLLVMYFFGVFHKINTDFLNPETSCATALWREMPWPLHLIDHSAMHYLAIYGTFLVEGILVLMLFNRRLRHLAVVFGIMFHLMLGLSNYAMYISFTTLAIALHCLFLNEESAKNIENSRLMVAIRDRVRNPVYFGAAIILGLLSVIIAMASREYSYVSLLMFPILLPFCFVIMRHGASRQVLLEPRNKKPALVIGTVLGVVFFLNCWSPYLGLKSAQTVNMFANIRLEAGVSNHLIMKDAPKPFSYLDDVVEIHSVTGAPGFKYYEVNNIGLVYYELLAQYDYHPDLVVTYTRNGKRYENITAEDLAEDMEEILHPRWFRKWFHFKQADLDQPEYCTN